MATKEEVLNYIKTLAEQRVLTREELNNAYDSGFGISSSKPLIKRVGVSEILYYIGGAIVFLGISIMIWQNWETLGTLARIIVTLGSGIAAYIVGLIFSRDEKLENMSLAFFLISALVMPLGLYAVFDSAGFDASSSGSLSVIAGILFVTYLLSYFLFRKTIFTLFSIVFGSWFFISFTSFLGMNPNFGWRYYVYRYLILGLTYICLAYFYAEGEHAPISGFLYGFGIFTFLGSALVLGGWSPSQNVFWELVYPGLVFATLFLSIQTKSKAFLTFGTLFLMAYILKITAEYFTEGLGWPLALIIAGLLLIAVGYTSLYLKKKYMA